jgi:hypothetical protein
MKVDQEELDRQMEKLRARFELEKKAQQEVLMKEAVKMFQLKTSELIEAITKEAHHLMMHCLEQRDDILKLTMEFKHSIGVIENQETIIFELRQMIEKTLHAVFMKMEKEGVTKSIYKNEQGFDLNPDDPENLKS